ncbi:MULTISPECIES: DUF2490 domain-containing protein [unclassified Novosphingobium]|uniref:DUF2490 domain-containing protein n=1 Tax=unclassified Novosphingobium TaxID=2644732 RepID=UPI000EBA8130|nr:MULTISPECIES: DUF2490 domain-containing protein [unclassified Novosphingobium]HCF25376.1 DUF2490 domain-containing protein [Novosphingobium sp.]HQV04129.1 DUF2490 domain-containing protein [Novosphingobium sp.]
MRKYLIAGALLVSTAIAVPARADDTQNWETLNVTVNLPDNFKLSSETVFRDSDARGFYEIEENLMVGKKLNKTVTVWLGYTFNPLYNAGTFRTREHRFRQQVNFDNVLQIGKVKVGGRIRLEQRWRENASGTAWRLRPQVKASVPIVGKVNFNLSHESFIDLNTQTFQGVEGYERMRNAASISWPLNKKFGVEVGYLEQHGFVPGGPDTNDHALTVGLNANF